MKEFLETLEYVWMNQILGDRIISFIYGVVTFLLFYHWTLNKLTKRNYTNLKASLVIILSLLAINSIIFFLQSMYRSHSVKANDLYLFKGSLIELSCTFGIYTYVNFIFLDKKNHIYRQLRVLLVFACFGLYFTSFSLFVVYPNYSLDLFNTLSIIIKATIATVLEILINNIFRNQEQKENQVKIEKLKLNEQVIKAQYEVLHAKVNPHFLYNSLNSIAGLAMVDSEKTKRMALSLSNFFKYSINRESRNITTIDEEIEMINTYLEIEKIRFGERLQYSISVDATTNNIKIPKFLLQPLVENSVKHGQNIKDNTLDIKVETIHLDKKLQISVKDQGRPFDVEINPGYGMKSVYDKLDLFCPGKYEISLVNSPEKSMNIIIEL